MAAHWTEEIVDYLHAQGVAVKGTTLFWGQLPATPVVCGAVIPTAGSPSEAKLGAGGVWLERPRAQVVFRGSADDVATPLATAQAAFLRLQQSASALGGATTYYTLQPLQSPYLRGYTRDGQPEIAFTIEAFKELTA